MSDKLVDNHSRTRLRALYDWLTGAASDASDSVRDDRTRDIAGT